MHGIKLAFVWRVRYTMQGKAHREDGMHGERVFLRELLSQLLAERTDAQGLYIPRGEAGMRRMIRHLIAMRPPDTGETDIGRAIARFEQMEREN